MSGGHQPSWLARRRAAVASAALIALVGAGIVALRLVTADAAGCAHGVGLRVAAAPDIAATVSGIGSDWLATRPRISGVCVALSVVSAEPAVVAAAFTARAGHVIEGLPTAQVGAPSAAASTASSGDALPAVWLPDSTAWLTQVQAVDRSAFDANAVSLASSPLVLAMPRPTAQAMGWPRARLRPAELASTLSPAGPLRLGVVQPRQSSAGLATAMMLGETPGTGGSLAGPVTGLRSVATFASTPAALDAASGIAEGSIVNAVPVAEQALLSYLAHRPGAVPPQLVALRMDPFPPKLDYPFAIGTGVSAETAAAAKLFRSALLAPAAAARFGSAGFRSPQGLASSGFGSALVTDPASVTDTDNYAGAVMQDPTRISRALNLWIAATAPARTLVILDLSSAMGSYISTPSGGRPRYTVMVNALSSAWDVFARDSGLGLWSFADTHLERAPIDTLTTERIDELDAQLATLRPQGGKKGAGLYATLLAAYDRMIDGFVPGELNMIVVLAHGGDTDTSAEGRKQFSQQMQRRAIATKPIHIVLVGIGANETDEASLRATAEAVGGAYGGLADPVDLRTILFEALVQAGLGGVD